VLSRSAEQEHHAEDSCVLTRRIGGQRRNLTTIFFVPLRTFKGPRVR
jgi:hypothetical protein